MAYFSDVRTGGSTFLDRIARVQSDLAERFAKYRTYRTTLAELRSLSDRELNDLGMNSSSLRYVAYEAAYKA